MDRSDDVRRRDYAALKLLMQEAPEFRRKCIMSGSLPQNPPEQDETVSLLGHTITAVQTICFLDLPAEIRNRIYELCMPSNERGDEIIAATPFKDDLMTMGSQPGITRVSKQVREESLAMFYANNPNNFVAYIGDYDFTALMEAIKHIAAGATKVMPDGKELVVQVKLLDKMECMFSLVAFLRAWRDFNHHGKIRLKVHDCSENKSARAVAYDQCAFVVRIVRLAENLRRDNVLTEERLRSWYHALLRGWRWTGASLVCWDRDGPVDNCKLHPIKRDNYFSVPEPVSKGKKYRWR